MPTGSDRPDTLIEKHCLPCEGGVAPLGINQANALLVQLHEGWLLREGGKAISRTFTFTDFDQTMAFVNAVAWIARQEDHHPDLEVGYSRCVVTYSTHAIDGLSENDFICAAKVDALFA